MCLQSVLSSVRRRFCGCIGLLVGALVLSWVHLFCRGVHHTFGACISIFVDASVLSCVHCSCCGCIGLVVGATVLLWVHWSCCLGIVVIGASDLSSVHRVEHIFETALFWWQIFAVPYLFCCRYTH